MKKKIVSILLIGIITVVGLGIDTSSADKSNKKNMELPKEHYILKETVGDINGDKENDFIYLVGKKESKDDIYSTEISLYIKDGRTSNVKKVNLDKLYGYDADMFIGDFTGDKINDLFISTSTGGSGGIINSRIIKLNEKKPKIIFSEKENEGIKVEGSYLSNFKVNLYTNIHKQFEIDLSFNKDAYIEDKVYDNNGKLLKQVKTWSDSFQDLKPVDYDGDGIYELVGNQSIFGTSHIDKISHLNSLWKYENNKWQPKEIEYSSFLIKQPIS